MGESGADLANMPMVVVTRKQLAFLGRFLRSYSILAISFHFMYLCFSFLGPNPAVFSVYSWPCTLYLLLAGSGSRLKLGPPNASQAPTNNTKLLILRSFGIISDGAQEILLILAPCSGVIPGNTILHCLWLNLGQPHLVRSKHHASGTNFGSTPNLRKVKFLQV